MYTLNQTEVRTLNDYNALKGKSIRLGPLVQEHQRILEFLFREYCESKYSCIEDTIEKIINECLSKDPRFIIGTTPTGRLKFQNHFKNFKDNFFTINNLRNKIQHQGYIPSETEADLSTQYFKDCLRYYFRHCIQKLRGDITASDGVSLAILNELFPSPVEKEEPVEREKFYIILLIDSSGSMQFPSNKICNGSKTEGLRHVQKAMSLAHTKALDSLRGSASCLKRSMLVYQYIFNEESDVLNPPKLLSPFGDDEVKKLNESNYIPGGLTALYVTIEEALKITYDKFLTPAKKISKRIDKVSIGVITDGDDNYIDGVYKEKNESLYNSKKAEKIKSIRSLLNTLRGNGNISELHLESSVLIGLTGVEFSETKLKEIQKELGFEVAISIDSEDEKSLRQAFKTASTSAINI
jgi:uncharacterized membrane protein